MRIPHCKTHEIFMTLKDLSNPQKGWVCPLCEKEEQEIKALINKGHPEHCAQRQIWGDGECECHLYEKGYNPYMWMKKAL